MQKINEKQAIELIKIGHFPKCAVARILKPIRSISELDNLKRIQSVQPFTLYGFSKSEISKFLKIPEDAIDVSLDEAITMVHSGDKIYVKVLGEKNIYKFVSSTSLLNFYKKNQVNGNSLLLFWKG